MAHIPDQILFPCAGDERHCGSKSACAASPPIKPIEPRAYRAAKGSERENYQIFDPIVKITINLASCAHDATGRLCLVTIMINLLCSMMPSSFDAPLIEP